MLWIFDWPVEENFANWLDLLIDMVVDAFLLLLLCDRSGGSWIWKNVILISFFTVVVYCKVNFYWELYRVYLDSFAVSYI